MSESPAGGTRSGEFLRRLRGRIRALFHRERADADLDEELRFHLEMETEHQMRMGLPEGEARRRARIGFGNVERYRDEARDARGVGAIDDFMRDVRIGVRSLRRAPGFAFISIFTVALGVGTTTAVFSLIDGILLRPLPYPNAGALVRIYERSAKYPASSFSGADFLDVERESKTLTSVAFFGDWPQTILGLAEPVRADVAGVSSRFFDVMGVQPAKGRVFLPGEGRVGEMRTAVISNRFWRETLGARGDWNSMLLHTDAGDSRIVGIMPPGFSYPSGADVWVAITNDNPSRTAHGLNVIGRVKQGRSIDDVRVELDHLFGALKAQLGNDIDAEGVAMRTLRESLTLRVKTLMFVLLSAVVLVLLVACTNLASANLARGEGQQRELAVRASLGASRGRLIRQLATEKIVLCMAGGVVGIVLAWMLVRVAVTLGPGTLPSFATVAVDVRVMAFGLLISIATGLITGIAPALRVTHDLRGLASSGGGGAGRRGGFRRPLIAAEIALATVLLIGAGLFLRSFSTLLAEDPGYRIEHIQLADIALPASGYANRNGGYGDTLTIPRFFSEYSVDCGRRPASTPWESSVRSRSAAAARATGFMIDGGVKATGSADYCVVDSAYFGALGIPLLQGRIFTSLDRAGAEHVVIVNRQAAEMYWPGVEPHRSSHPTAGHGLTRGRLADHRRRHRQCAGGWSRPACRAANVRSLSAEAGAADEREHRRAHVAASRRRADDASSGEGSRPQRAGRDPHDAESGRSIGRRPPVLDDGAVGVFRAGALSRRGRHLRRARLRRRAAAAGDRRAHGVGRERRRHAGADTRRRDARCAARVGDRIDRRRISRRD